MILKLERTNRSSTHSDMKWLNSRFHLTCLAVLHNRLAKLSQGRVIDGAFVSGGGADRVGDIIPMII